MRSLRFLKIPIVAVLLIGFCADTASAGPLGLFGRRTTNVQVGSVQVGSACKNGSCAPATTFPGLGVQQALPVTPPSPIPPPPIATCMGTISVCVNGSPVYLAAPTDNAVLMYDITTGQVYWSTVGALAKKVQTEIEKGKK